MFSGERTGTGERVYSLVPENQRDRLYTYKSLAREGIIVCPGCKATTTLRAIESEYKRPYFAHNKKDPNCTFDASPAIMEARAVLFEWLTELVSDKGRVDLEYQPPGVPLPRAADCWVRKTNDERQHAFWVFDAGLKLDDSEQVLALDEDPYRLAPVFVFAKLARATGFRNSAIDLTKTQRRFLKQSNLDQMYANGNSVGSIHFLNAATKELHTFRGCGSLYGHPNIHFPACETVSQLREVRLRGDGQLLHPGEAEKLNQWRAAEEAREAAEATRREEEDSKWRAIQEADRRQREKRFQIRHNSPPVPLPAYQRPIYVLPSPQPQPLPRNEPAAPAGRCRHCKHQFPKDDCVFYDPVDLENCICRECNSRINQERLRKHQRW